MSDIPLRQIAGIDIPDTPLVKGAIEVARAALDGVVFNHVMRSTLYGFVIGDSIYPKRDRGRMQNEQNGIVGVNSFPQNYTPLQLSCTS